MKLKQLSLHGFKSFAHPSEFVFDTPITAIVGPNGSGKSNVVESIRFVLGEQSMKSLRGSAGADLIFKGSGSGSARSMSRASVSITFDNTDRSFSLSSIDNSNLSVDFDEVTVSREVFADGKNSYQINGVEVRLKDVMELIASVNIGASGHHIISQGEADRLLNAHVRERREMLEDALGLKVYQYRIRETERKLKKTNDNLAESDLLRRELAPHLRFLKRQVDKVERAHQLRTELTETFGAYYADATALVRAQESHARSEHERISTQALELKQQLEAYESRLATGARSEAEEEMSALESKIAELTQQKNDIMRSLGRIEGQIESVQKTLKRLAQPPLPGVTPVIRIELSSVEEVMGTVRAQLEDARQANDLSAFSKAIDQSIKTFDQFLKKFAKEKPTHEPADTSAFQSELAELEAQYAELTQALNSLAQQEKALRDQEATLTKEIDNERVGARRQEHDMFALNKQFNELQTQASHFVSRAEVFAREKRRLQEEFDEVVVLLGNEPAIVKPSFGTHDIATLDIGALEARLENTRRTIERTKIKIEEIGGGSGDDVMQEYTDTLERDQFLEREITDMRATADSLSEVITRLKEQLHAEFEIGITKINTEFNNFFTLMFGGGNASLAVVPIQTRKRSRPDEEVEGSEEPETEDNAPLEYGIDINVKLPRKRVQDLAMLSGGERSLTSIALLFALSQVNPPPFLVLDETDAALDEANSKKYGDMVESLAKISQLIVVTHNRETMSRAHALYGVTLGADDSSQLLSVKFDDALEYAK